MSFKKVGRLHAWNEEEVNYSIGLIVPEEMNNVDLEVDAFFHVLNQPQYAVGIPNYQRYREFVRSRFVLFRTKVVSTVSFVLPYIIYEDLAVEAYDVEDLTEEYDGVLVHLSHERTNFFRTDEFYEHEFSFNVEETIGHLHAIEDRNSQLQSMSKEELIALVMEHEFAVKL